jgi:PAB-dependent poly(A)-specific ribonuclease subunit 3
MEKWRQMKHPNVVSLREAFTTKAFNDNCTSTLLGINHLPIDMPLTTALMMVYDFHPNSTTLEEEHLNPEMMAMTPRRKSPPPIPERLLWSYITQIANAIKAIHSSGMALRGLDPSRIILTGKNRCVSTLVTWVCADDRIRLTGVGILDVVSYDPHVHISGLQVRHLPI